jgi:UDP-GlcNAc:undecaprenyl-phosphate GlcNAc-1-phosphate transferase
MFNLPGYLLNPYFLPLLFLAGGLLTASITPLVIRRARKMGAIDRGGYRRNKEGFIPLLGGLGIALPFTLIGLILAGGGALIIRNWRWIYHTHPSWLNSSLDFALERDVFSHGFIVLVLGGILIAGLGVLDDLRQLRVRVKLLGQIIVAVFICATGHILPSIYLPFIGTVELSPASGLVISVIWVVGIINAFNLIDGLDGLAAGAGLITSLALAVLGAISGNPLIILVCVALAGSLFSFLFFNFHPARIFLGDTGSMFIGYVLAAVTLMGTHKSETATILLAPMLALSFPIFETLISMVRRFIRGVPIFTADNFHTHHRLLHKGLSERQVVLLLYAVTLLLAVSSILSQVIPEDSPWIWFPPSLYLGSLIGIAAWAGYLSPSSLNRLFQRRQRNAILGAFARYASQNLSLSSPAIPPDEIMDLCRREMNLAFLEAGFKRTPGVIGSSGDLNREDALSLEKLLVDSAGGERIVIRYRFLTPPDENERRDIIACLAGIFEQSNLKFSPGKNFGLVGRGLSRKSC